MLTIVRIDRDFIPPVYTTIYTVPEGKRASAVYLKFFNTTPDDGTVEITEVPRGSSPQNSQAIEQVLSSKESKEISWWPYLKAGDTIQCKASSPKSITVGGCIYEL